MKKSLYRIALLAVCLLAYTSCCIGQSLKSALSDIKNNRVSSSTISALESSSRSSGDEAESYYNLARIYHFNAQYSNLEQARQCYQKVLSIYSMGNYEKQMKKFHKKYGVDANSLRSTIKEVDELICNKAFSQSLKENTFNGYVLFAKKYPTSSLVNAAKDKALSLKKTQNTIAGYKEFMTTFPDYRTDEVKQFALNVAKTKNTTNDYIEFVNQFGESISNVGDLNLPIFQNVNEYLKVYKASLKNKDAETKKKFTDQFLATQNNYCKGNEQRLRAFCQGSPYDIELTDGQKNTIKGMMHSVKSDNLVYYTGANQGYMLHDGNQFYEGSIKNGIREGHGEEYYANGDHYSGNFSNGKYNGAGFYYTRDGWCEYLQSWNNGVKEGHSTRTRKENRKLTYEWSGNYHNGQEEGEWSFTECLEPGLFGQITGLGKTYCNKTIFVYSNGKCVNSRTVSNNLSNYYEQNRASNIAYSNQKKEEEAAAELAKMGNIKNAKVEFARSYEVWFPDGVVTEYHVTFGDGTYGSVGKIDWKKSWFYHTKWDPDLSPNNPLSSWYYGGDTQQEAIEELYKALH